MFARGTRNGILTVMETEIGGASPHSVRLGLPAVCAFFIALLVFLFHTPYLKSNYLLSDSADYLRAAQSPFIGTYLNTNSATPVHLLSLRNDPEFRTHPWDYLYFHGDNAAIRHFHAPFSFYAMHVVTQASSASRSQRVLSSLVTAATSGVIVLGLFWFGVPLPVAAMLALVAGIQSRYTEVSADPSPHGWYMLFAVCFLFTFAAYLRNRRMPTLLVSVVFLAFAFATLEFSLELVASIPVALVVLWLEDRSRLRDPKALLISILKAIPVFLVATFILWPGGWLRGGYLESYGVTGATLLLHNKAAFGERLTVSDLYAKFFAGHEALLLLFAFFLVATVVLLVRRKLSTVTVVFTSYTVVALGLGVADHFRLDTYVSEALLFLLITEALLFMDLMMETEAAKRKYLVAAAVVVLLATATQEWFRRPSTALYGPWLGPVLTGVAGKVPSGATILVNDNWEAYYEYLPKYDYEPTVSTTDMTPRIPARTKNVRYFLLSGNAPEIPDTELLESFPTNVPGRSVNLYGK